MSRSAQTPIVFEITEFHPDYLKRLGQMNVPTSEPKRIEAGGGTIVELTTYTSPKTGTLLYILQFDMQCAPDGWNTYSAVFDEAPTESTINSLIETRESAHYLG